MNGSEQKMTEAELYQQRLAFIGEKNDAEEMEQLKKNYTFHALKFEDCLE